MANYRPIVKGIGFAFAGWKVASIVYDASKALALFGIELIKLPAKIVTVTVAQWNLVAAKVADKVETLAIIGLYTKDFLVAIWKTVAAIGTQTLAWIANGLQIAAQAAALAALKVAQLASAGVTWALTAAQWALNAAFVASPIGWVVLAIGALIGIGILLWKNWDTIKTKAFELWEGIKTAFAPIGDFFKGVFEKAWQGIKSFINCIISGVNKLIKGINKLDMKIPDWVPGLGGKGFDINIPEIPMLAKGTNNFAGGIAIVGEKGPELVNLPRGSQVLPNSKTEQILSQTLNPIDIPKPKDLTQIVKQKLIPANYSQIRKDNNMSVPLPRSIRQNNQNDKFEQVSQDKNINININGKGSIKIDSESSKEAMLNILLENIKPILMNILQEEIFEEGELSYDF
ncbi:hypothetical protein [Caloranaerobacter azorensis]|uniref:Phage tail tape measure protein n=1 Tax=Caloranaerobacter azorensis TaxID=116090 RepID=A0A6P1YD48_9FIRM|nr:hypothetical protein [Caloranaerobacter azorensis]QIB26105.1 hypothetical protein G3A45_01540 [Caloranaerobacter azorensis]